MVSINAYIDPDKGTVATPVYIELVQGSVRVPPGEIRSANDTINEWVRDRGLRAQLKSQSLVTGKLYVSLGLHPDTPVTMVGLDPKVPEIPAIPTEMEEIEATFKNLVARIEKMPLEDIVQKLDAALRSADALLSDPKLKDAIANLDDTLAETRTFVGRLNSSYDGLAGDLEGTLEQATKTLANADAAVSDVRTFIEPGSPVHYEILVALEELSRTLRSIRALTDALSRDPEQLIFGRGRPGAQQ